LEVIHLDRYFWNPGWVMTPFPLWIEKVGELVEGESWIVDGNYARTLPIRLERADGVIWLDFPRRICLYRCLKRAVLFYGRSRSDMAPGCVERFDWEFIRYIWTFPKRERPIVEEVLNAHKGHIPVLHLKSPRDVDIEEIIGFAMNRVN
jgi:adenylate kinase family enzyme